MSLTEATRSAIERGKQRGCAKSMEVAGSLVWFSAGIQRCKGKYVAHVSEIADEAMPGEYYSKFFTRAFDTLDEAAGCVQSNSPILLADLGPLKGQLLFNPAIEEELDA